MSQDRNKDLLQVGTVLNGRYRIEKELAPGGIGEVYVARDLQLMSRAVVIKVLGDRGYQNAWIRNKFRHEIEALTRIDHPGVIGIYDMGDLADGRPFFVMPFVAGVNLRAYIHENGMPALEAASLLFQIADALAAAHEVGILHRDLKPENIMVQQLSSGARHIKLIDFGLARVESSQLGDRTQVVTVAGTLAYMAPEQLMAMPASVASDIYALGVVAYEVLLGRPPFPTNSIHDRLTQERARAVCPADMCPPLTEKAANVIARALSFDPQLRQLGAHEFSRQFAEAISLASPDSRGGARQGVPSQETTTGPARDPLTLPPGMAEITFIPDGEPSRPALMPSGPRDVPTVFDIRHAVPASTSGSTPMPAGVQVVVLYKHGLEPDESLASFLEMELGARGFDVFVDHERPNGLRRAQEIEPRLRRADIVIVLLSAISMWSEMLALEVQTAREAAQGAPNGRPKLLPVRVGYLGPLQENLAAFLDPDAALLWSGPEDSPDLTERLCLHFQHRVPPVAPPALEPVGGALALDSRFYVRRNVDEELENALSHRTSIICIKGARQMGKTSLLARALQQARQERFTVALTDFQKFTAAHFESPLRFYLGLADSLADQLDLESPAESSWSSIRSPNMNFDRFIRREVLNRVPGQLVWGLDEVDRLFTCGFGSEVFGLFRSWHNSRALDPTGPWGRVTLAIAYASEAQLFITDLNQSPFNVGTRLALQDFSGEQVAELNLRYGAPLKGRSELERFYRLIGGQPYLAQRGLFELSTRGIDIGQLEQVAGLDDGPFGDHLRRLVVALLREPVLCEAVRKILRGGQSPSVESFLQLRSAGIVSGPSVQRAKMRCEVYGVYLDRHLPVT